MSLLQFVNDGNHRASHSAGDRAGHHANIAQVNAQAIGNHRTGHFQPC